MEEEIWVGIKNYEGLYQVSTFGNVKALYKEWICGIGGLHKKEEHIMKPQSNSEGYLSVPLSKDGKFINRPIHKLVAEHFIPNPKSKLEVNHIDHNNTNNNVANLEWNTRLENQFNAVLLNRQYHKLSVGEVEIIRRLWSLRLYKQPHLASVFNVHQSTISKTVNKKRRPHNDYLFNK